MTELLYFFSDQLSAEAVVQKCREVKGGYEVTLNRTAFHPQGGGQPSDIGCIGESLVAKVIRKEGLVVHCVNTPVAIGPVTLHVDGQARHLHSRLHTAGHLIGHAAASLGFAATRAHHWPGEARVLVSPPFGAEPLAAAALQVLVDTLIKQDLPRVIHISEDHREVGFGDTGGKCT